MALWSGLLIALLSLQYAARRIAPSKGGPWLGGWVQFDGPEYLAIAAEGYTRRQLVWFPAYPAAVRLVDTVLGDPVVAAVVVSAVAGGCAVGLYWTWCRLQGLDPRGQWWALAVLLLYPYGWFLFGVVYSDALFLASALYAFVLVERGRPGLAALAGAVATACRPSGFAVVAGLVVLSMERAGALAVPGPSSGWLHSLRVPVRFHAERCSWRVLLPACSSLGLLAVMAYQWSVWGTPVGFVREQSNYHDGGIATLLKLQYFEAWTQGFDGRHLATTTAQAVLLLLVLGSVPAVGRRFGWGYALFVLGLALLPAVSVSTFMGVGRYLLPAFPAFALLGERLARLRHPVVGVSLLTASGVAMAVMAAGFARSWYLT